MIISRIQALNYGCMRYVDVPLGRFHLLIGPNASGKSTLMDAVKFVSDVVRDGVDKACETRTANFSDLVWERPTELDRQRFEIALEFELPEEVRNRLPAERDYRVFRYEIAVGLDTDKERVALLEERGVLQPSLNRQRRQLSFFPSPAEPPPTIMQHRQSPGRRTVFSKNEAGRSRFNDETVQKTGSVNWNPGLNLSAGRSALSILPDYDDKYPASTSAMVFLRDQVVSLALNSEIMRRASRPGYGNDLRADGANVPWVADTLLQQAPQRARHWIKHIQGALDGFKSVRVIDRPDDRHKYLMLKYDNGLEVPSWKASDGTLRLLALTMLAYMPPASGLYIIEEPENGIHPGALEAVFNSLSSVYDAQVLLATHSPEFVAVANIEQLLCFGRNGDGAADIVPGEAHPNLREWQCETDLGTFFATGILA